MKILYSLLLLAIQSCFYDILDQEGVYIYHSGMRNTLRPQMLKQDTYHHQSIWGIQSLSGLSFTGFDSIILCSKNIQPDSVKLLKLIFIRGEFIEGIASRKWAKVELWTKETDIPIQIQSYSNRNDLYKIVLSENPEKGIYALYPGTITGFDDIKVIYDFKIE